jgi:hypothetical protein
MLSNDVPAVARKPIESAAKDRVESRYRQWHTQINGEYYTLSSRSTPPPVKSASSGARAFLPFLGFPGSSGKLACSSCTSGCHSPTTPLTRLCCRGCVGTYMRFFARTLPDAFVVRVTRLLCEIGTYTQSPIKQISSAGVTCNLSSPVTSSRVVCLRLPTPFRTPQSPGLVYR